MSQRFQELDSRPTSIGQISLRRRHDPTVERDIYEIKLDDDFLMSSLFTVGEVELARLGLARITGRSTGSGLDVLVGGLGLGYTAQTVLEHDEVRSMTVVERIGEVIEWHRLGLIPTGPGLVDDRRCRFVNGDFFAVIAAGRTDDDRADGIDDGALFHAVLLDIDHGPSHLLDPGHAEFYTGDGLRRLADRLHPGGVFALWSNDPPEPAFEATLAKVFVDVDARVVRFHNPLQSRYADNTVYLASAPA